MYILCPSRQQPTLDGHAVRVKWFSRAAFDMNEFLLLCYVDMHGLPIMFLNDYIPLCNFDCNSCLEFTEEGLTVFLTCVHALLCVYFWLLGTCAKTTR